MAEQNEFEIDLFAAGNAGGYHTQNLPDQMQRDHLVQYGDGPDRIVEGRLVDVIHGRLSPDGAPASLVVSTFKFLASTPSKRFRHAKITWDFAYADSKGREAPEVRKISLDGQFVTKVTTFDESTEKKMDAGLQGSGGPASLSLSAGWGHDHSAKIDDHISLYGTSISTQKQSGEPNAAMWVLEENKSQKSGIPGSLTTAILVKRKPDRQFIGKINIHAKMVATSSIEDPFGRKPKVHPVVFDLALPPTNANYDSQNLDSIVLDDIGVVKRFTSMEMSSAEK